MTRKRWVILSVAAVGAGFTLAAAPAVWGGEAPASAGKGPPKVGGEVEIANVPFDINEVIRTVRKNRGLPEEPPKQGFHAEARGERPFVSKGSAFSHETPRFQAEIGENGLRYFAQGNKGQPDFEILSVRFEQGGVPQTVFGKNRLEEHAPGLLQGKARDGVTPYARNRGEEGVELYWVVEENVGRGLLTAPSGGDTVPALQVIFTVRAAGEPQEHPEGLVFPAWREEGQVTLSNVTVVDAAGRLEGIRPSLASGREVLFEVPHEFLASAQYPILIDPTVGPEFPVEPSPVYNPAVDQQEGPSVASNGTDYFVAWSDERSGVDYDIYGTRVASDGTVLDPGGIAVSTAANTQWGPSVASNGTDYFVAWSDERGGVMDHDIYGTRVTSGGSVLDPSGIAISTAAISQQGPSVASNGTDYFVAWRDGRSGTDYDVYGTRVTSAGTVLDPAGIAVSTAADDQYWPSAASNGTDYFIAWHDFRNGFLNRDIYGARVRASDGLLLDGPPDTGGIAVSTAADIQHAPSVASNGTDYFVAWEDRRSGADDDIYGARVTSAGTVLDPAGIAVSTAADDQRYTSVASNGTDYFVAWHDYRNDGFPSNPDVYGARVTSAGTVLDPAGIAVSTAADDQYWPSAASNGTDYFIAWNDARNWGTTYWDIYGTRVASSDGTVLDPAGIAVSTAASTQTYPSVASNGTDYFVAWDELRSGAGYNIYGARVASDGTVLDLTGIAVSTAAYSQWFPSVASTGTDYFIAWSDGRSGTDYDIYGARVTSAGTVLDPAGIAVSTAANGQVRPSADSNGTDYFVAWQDRRSFTDRNIYGARVAPDGTVLDPAGIAVSTAANDQYVPSVASNGTDYFVAWTDFRSGSKVNSDIYGTRVASDGTVLDPTPTDIAVSTAASYQEYPSVASNGADYFVAWRDYRSGADYDVYGARLRASDGVLLDGPPDTGGIAVSTAANYQSYPSAASNGTEYFVAWSDGRSGVDDDIYGARVTSAGTVLDPAGILIQQSLYDDLYPAVAYSACGKYLVAYQRFYDDPNFQSQRVMARTIYEADVTIDAGFDPLPTLTELCGDGDGVVEPGEKWQVTVQLINATACPANNVKADLTVNPGSVVVAAVCNNPGVYGNIPAGGTAQFTYSFVVDAGAICINDITFDVTGIASDEGAYASEIPAFAVQVGALAPGPTETGIQATDPMAATDGTVTSDFAPAFTIPGAAKSATLSYTLSGGTDLVACVEVALVDPFATATVVKPLGVADANPYDVTGLYTGAGTYQLRLMEDGAGCGGGGKAKVAAGTLSVTVPDVTECDASACACLLPPPSEPSPVGSPDPMLIPTTAADQIIVEDVANETGYVVYEGAIGTWYGTPSQWCLWGADVVDLGATVQLNYLLGAGDRWVVVSAANAAGESSCGMDSAGAERNAQPGWPVPGPCP